MAQQDRQGQGSQQKKDKKSGSDSGTQRQGNRQDDTARDRKDSE